MFVTTELEKELRDREYLKIFNENGNGQGLTKGLSPSERNQLKNVYFLTTLGLFFRKIKLLHLEEVNELIKYMCDYFDSKYFEKTSIASKYLDINDPSFIKEIRNQRITESDKIEMVKMWNSRIFNQLLCSFSPSYKRIYESLDEKEMVEWYFNFMFDIDDDIDKMLESYEKKEDLWNIDFQKGTTKLNESDIWYRDMMWNVDERKPGDLWVDRSNTPFNGMVYGYMGNDERVEWGKLVDGKQEGIWKFFHPNGQVMSEMFFEDGDMKELIGRWNEDGSVKND